MAGTFERAHGEPIFVPMVMTDHISGLIAAQCIGFALYRREKTGRGAHVHTSLLANGAWAHSMMIQGALVGFDMTEHYRGGSRDAQFMGGGYHLHPLLDGDATGGDQIPQSLV